eukprot:6192761-Pleurochrysis_carterae.AAC.2
MHRPSIWRLHMLHCPAEAARMNDRAAWLWCPRRDHRKSGARLRQMWWRAHLEGMLRCTRARLSRNIAA